MSSSAVLRGAIRTRNHDHPPAEKLTHPHARRIPVSTEKLSTGLRNVRLLVRPQLVSTAPVLWSGFRGPGAAARSGSAGACAAPRAPGDFLTMYPVSGDGPESSQTVHRDDASRASRAHIWHVGGVAVLGCRARYKSHITRHINNIALWRHNPHINA